MIKELIIYMLANHYRETVAQARQNFSDLSHEGLQAAFAQLTFLR